MNEYQTFIQMLTRIGANFIKDKHLSIRSIDDPNVAFTITLNNSGEKLNGILLGYTDFMSEWHFDKDGNLIRIGHYEE